MPAGDPWRVVPAKRLIAGTLSPSCHPSCSASPNCPPGHALAATTTSRRASSDRMSPHPRVAVPCRTEAAAGPPRPRYDLCQLALPLVGHARTGTETLIPATTWSRPSSRGEGRDNHFRARFPVVQGVACGESSRGQRTGLRGTAANAASDAPARRRRGACQALGPKGRRHRSPTPETWAGRRNSDLAELIHHLPLSSLSDRAHARPSSGRLTVSPLVSRTCDAIARASAKKSTDWA